MVLEAQEQVLAFDWLWGRRSPRQLITFHWGPSFHMGIGRQSRRLFFIQVEKPSRQGNRERKRKITEPWYLPKRLWVMEGWARQCIKTEQVTD
jgi:hypothetical protein